MNTSNRDRFSLIYADPAWHWKARSQKGEDRSAKNHYTVTSLEDMKRLPVSQIAADRSILAMWVIDPMLPQALELGEAWGFQFATVGFYWVKTNKKSPIQFEGNKALFDSKVFDISKYRKGMNLQEINLSMGFEGISVFFTGLGYYTRANVEQLWLFSRTPDRKKGIRGGGLRVLNHGVPRLLVAPVGKHSQKPEEAATRLELLFGDVPRIELFARSRRPNWEAWGNEIEDSYKLESE